MRRSFCQSARAISRRRLLQSGVSVMATLPGGQHSHGASAGGEGRNVAVIGAGFAGLACAYELSLAGRKVDLFEARNRLGGRVHSGDRFAPGRHVEFGAEMIGGNHPQWLKYAARFGIDLETIDDEEGGADVVLDGHRYTGDEAKTLKEEIERGHKELALDAAEADAEFPWRTPNAESLDQQSLQWRIERMETTARAKRAIAVEFLMDMACHPARMNYLALMCVIKGHGVDRYWSETEMYRARHGNQILASRLAAHVSGKIYLDCPVVAIHSGDSGCTVMTRDQRRFQYSDVVLTVPPSVWNEIDFVPSLPSGFRPQMGAATKYLSVVRNAYWQNGGKADLMTDTSLGMTWEGARATDSAEKLLISFAGGTVADELHSHGVADRDKLLAEEFEKFVPGFRENLLHAEFVDWIDDQWTRGGYSFPLPGKFLSQARVLHDGIGPLHFAGEHASFRFFGFMEGGLHSGVQAAQRVTKRSP